MGKLHYTNCPVCDSNDIHPLLTVKDHSVSCEEFVIWQCDQCSLRFTQDAPDESAIGPYYQSPEYISHTNTDKGLLNKLYQKVRSFTLQKKAQLVIRHTVSQGSILDIGAGIGAFLQEMKRRNWQIKGIEPDKGTRERAQKLYGIDLQPQHQLQALSPGSFDAITLWHVLEHVEALHEYMERLKILLKPGGKIFIAVPNYRSLDAAFYQNNWAAYDVPRHLYHFTPKAMEALVRHHNLEILSRKPMWFDSFYISLLSSKYQKGRTSWFPAVMMGLRSNLKAVFNRESCSSLIYVIARDQS
ncbi:MAG: class I SAM-dependent methyltransferase [Flavisolibacter sp.]